MTEQDYNSFWSRRKYQLVGSYPINGWKDRKVIELTARAEKVQEARESFFSSDIVEHFLELEQPPVSEAEALLHWAINKSWSFCLKCCSLKNFSLHFTRQN